MGVDIKDQIKNTINRLLLHGQAKHIAEKIGVEEATLSRWRTVNKPGTPSFHEAIKLAEALEVSLYELAGIERKDEAFNHPVIHEIADILADLPQDKLRILHRITNQFPKISEDLAENIASMIELMAFSQQTTYSQSIPHKTPDLVAERTLAAIKYVSNNEVRDAVSYDDDGAQVSFPSYEIAAGDPIPPDTRGGEWFCVGKHELPRGAESKTHGVVRVRGDSMVQAGIEPRNYVLVRYSPEPEHDAIMAVWRQDAEGVTLKRVRRKGGVWMICWENGTGRQEVLGKEDKIIGKYVKIVRSVGMK